MTNYQLQSYLLKNGLLMYMVEKGLCNFNSDTHNRIYSRCEELIRLGQKNREVFEQVGSEVGLSDKSVERIYYLLRQPVPDHIADAFFLQIAK